MKSTKSKNFVSWLKKNKFYIASAFFIIIQLMILYKYTQIIRFSNILWFCGHTPIIFSLAFLTKNITMIKAFISIGLIPQLIWIVDYFGKLFFGVFIFGSTDYMFLEMSTFSYIVSLIEHFFPATLALLLTYKFKPNKKVFVYAFIYLLIILILTLSLTGPEFNYNLTRHVVLGQQEVTFPGYQYAWIFITMILFVIPTYYLQVFLYKKHSKKKKEKIIKRKS